MVLVGFLLVGQFGYNLMAQTEPESGEKFRIVNGSGLYLTCDPEYNEGNNPWFLDSLYTEDTTISLEYELNGEEVTEEVTTQKSQQTFTLINPDPNDPDVWAIEAANGEYLAQSPSYAWDCVLSPTADEEASQLFFLDQGSNIYFLQLLTRSSEEAYLASDSAIPGQSIGSWDDGWEYVKRSYIFNDKPSTQENNQAFWYFEKLGVVNSVKNVERDGGFKVYPSLTSHILNTNLRDNTNVVVYDMTGVKVVEKKISGELDVTELRPGAYIIRTETGQVAKFFKE